jgi:hypothetical protein
MYLRAHAMRPFSIDELVGGFTWEGAPHSCHDAHSVEGTNSPNALSVNNPQINFSDTAQTDQEMGEASLHDSDATPAFTSTPREQFVDPDADPRRRSVAAVDEQARSDG